MGGGPGVQVYSCDGGVRTGEGGSEDQRKMGALSLSPVL